MTIEAFIQFVTQQGVWCALFVWLFFSSNKDSKTRETRLMTCVEVQGEQMKNITATLGNINERLEDIEEAIKEKK